MAISPQFILERQRINELKREQMKLAYDLIKEFLRLRGGDVTLREVGDLFKLHGMPFPAYFYPKARVELGLPLRKLATRSHPRTRPAELRAQFKELLDTTPDEKRPRHIIPPNGHAPVSPPEPVDVEPRMASVEISTSDLSLVEAVRGMSIEVLVAAHDELQRRLDEAKKLRAFLDRKGN